MLVKVFEIFAVPASCSTQGRPVAKREDWSLYVSWEVNKRAVTPRCGCGKLGGGITMRRGEEAEEDDVLRLDSVLNQHPHCLDHCVPCACRHTTQTLFTQMSI